MDSNYDKSIRDFKSFVSLRNKVTFYLSAIIFICYYLFIASIGLFPEILGYKLGPSAITLGILIGVFLIILCCVITGLYTFFANYYFDKRQKEIIKALEQSGALKDLKDGKIN
ncbi:DUF485 domain-containing protein [Campylobacter sp. MG1]|uniref:DUF485 domain-containing protein n=1 Tax=Campylobacter sp. MG1 TaxID=2976332 RepID=UPI00226D3386|nr:DUF485 domain-containing protein [Campylobacter sp. MG1]